MADRELGKQFVQPVRGLVTWLQTHWSTIRSARETFDAQSKGLVSADLDLCSAAVDEELDAGEPLN